VISPQPSDLSSALAKLRLTQSGFARLTDIDPRTVRRYIAYPETTPQWVVLLLRAWIRSPAILDSELQLLQFGVRETNNTC
jgi:hypothetical protein